jgi:iron complex outermembrane receptor protein
VTIGMVRRHHAIEGKLRDVGDWFQDVKFQGGYTNYTHTEYSSLEGAGPVFNNSGLDSRIEARQRSISLGNGLQLEGMLGFQRENNNLGASGEEKFIPSSRTQSTALFTYQALKTSWGQWSAGARTERVSVQSLEDIASDVSTTISAQTKTFNPVSFALGVMRNLRMGEMQEGWQITSNLSASQRAPKDYELFANGAHAATGTFEVGSPNNTLEKATQLDVGGEWKKGVHKFGLTAFTSNFSN